MVRLHHWLIIHFLNLQLSHLPLGIKLAAMEQLFFHNGYAFLLKIYYQPRKTIMFFRG